MENAAQLARERLERAKDAYLKVAGKPVDEMLPGGPEVTCEALYTCAAVLTWFAAQSVLQDLPYADWYIQGAQMYETAATAQGCA
jgi:hypothetical protein